MSRMAVDGAIGLAPVKPTTQPSLLSRWQHLPNAPHTGRYAAILVVEKVEPTDPPLGSPAQLCAGMLVTVVSQIITRIVDCEALLRPGVLPSIGRGGEAAIGRPATTTACPGIQGRWQSAGIQKPFIPRLKGEL